MPDTGMTPDGKKYLLDVVFRGVEPTRELWAGVARRPLGAVSLASLTAAEPESGYARQALFPLDWERQGELEIVARRVQFENRGDGVWALVVVAFIATSKDASGVLLAWDTLRDTSGQESPRTLLPGDTLLVPTRVSF